MLLLTSVSDLVQVITGAAGTIAVHTDWMDNLSGTVTPGRTNTAAITSATTTTVVASPASSTQRNTKGISISNTDASVTNPITVQHTDGTTVEVLWKGSLLAGERVIFDENGDWFYYDVTGAVKPSSAVTNPNNISTSNQTPAAGTDTILTGSTITIPPSKIKIGSRFRYSITIAKTAAGTVASTFTFRIGTNGGTTADTAVLTFSTGTGTAAIDTGEFELDIVCRGPLTSSAIFQGTLILTHNLSVTGWSTTGVCVASTSSAFDITQTNLTASVSFNGGTSLVATVSLVAADTVNL